MRDIVRPGGGHLPGFVCIGAQKAATSWLARTLAEHPRVWIPPIGEPHFFDRPGKPLRKRVRQLAERAVAASADPALAEWADRVLAHDTVTPAWYEAVFTDPAGDGRIGGDVTPAYLGLDAAAVAGARDLLGEVPVVVVIRSPLQRELSQLRMWATRTAGGLTPPRTEQDWLDRYRLMVQRAPRGGYSAGLPLWERAFPRLLALPYGDVRERPEQLVAAVEEHIGVEAFGGYSALRTPVHTSRRAELPESVVARASARVEGEEAFLRERFGEDFLARTR